MRKDTTIFSELQEFFQQNDAHKAINRISNVMNSLKLHKNKIGIEKAENSRYTTIQILHLLLLFPFFMVMPIAIAVLHWAICFVWKKKTPEPQCLLGFRSHQFDKGFSFFFASSRSIYFISLRIFVFRFTI